jgi:prevent-host-death family protein
VLRGTTGNALDHFPLNAHILTSLIDQSKALSMREIAASDAKARLLQLLGEVEAGETLVITRHGRPIARLVPEAAQRQSEIAAAIDAIASRRRLAPSITATDLLLARDEGRK